MLRIELSGFIMRDMKKLLIVFLLMAGVNAHGAELTGVAHVNMTSDTSMTAKTMAMNDARRQILMEKLSPYAMSDQLLDAMRAAKSSELVNLISETSIDDEKISDTAYSAKITMTVDKSAARAWMNEHGVQNWLNDGSSTDVFVAQVTLKDAVSDWADFNRMMRGERVDIATKYIAGKTVTIELPASMRTAIGAALRSAGWRTSVKDDVMHIWK